MMRAQLHKIDEALQSAIQRMRRAEEGFAAAFGRNRAKNDVPSVERAKDNSLERLRASWGSGKELKGGLS